MDFKILGPLEVRDGERELALGGRGSARCSGCCLFTRTKSSRAIAWSTSSGVSPRSKALQVAISRLRKIIGRTSSPLARPATSCASSPDSSTCIASRSASARAGRPVGRATPLGLRRADRGSGAVARAALSDLAFEASPRPGSRGQELRLAAREDRIEAELALGRHAEIVGELEALTAAHPLRERPRAQLCSRSVPRARRRSRRVAPGRARPRSDPRARPGEAPRAARGARASARPRRRGRTGAARATAPEPRSARPRPQRHRPPTMPTGPR